jgi:hypothetical protein
MLVACSKKEDNKNDAGIGCDEFKARVDKLNNSRLDEKVSAQEFKNECEFLASKDGKKCSSDKAIYFYNPSGTCQAFTDNREKLLAATKKIKEGISSAQQAQVEAMDAIDKANADSERIRAELDKLVKIGDKLTIKASGLDTFRKILSPPVVELTLMQNQVLAPNQQLEKMLDVYGKPGATFCFFSSSEKEKFDQISGNIKFTVEQIIYAGGGSSLYGNENQPLYTVVHLKGETPRFLPPLTLNCRQNPRGNRSYEALPEGPLPKGHIQYILGSDFQLE